MKKNKTRSQDSLIKTVISFIFPYAILYAIYIQLNGEVSPGGGFQAGVIFASAIIAYDLTSKPSALRNYINIQGLLFISHLGVLLYALTGAISFLFDDNFLDYSKIGQHLGIFLIELGVGMTVASVMCLIYFILQRKPKID